MDPLNSYSDHSSKRTSSLGPIRSEKEQIEVKPYLKKSERKLQKTEPEKESLNKSTPQETTDQYGRRKFSTNKTETPSTVSIIKDKLKKSNRLNHLDSKPTTTSNSESFFIATKEGRGVTPEQAKRAQEEHKSKLMKWQGRY